MNDIAGVPTIIPVLAVEDIQTAIIFYSHLGFREVFTIPDRSGKLAHAHLRKGDSVLFLGRLDVSHYGGHRRAETIGGSRSIDRGIGITLILQVDNLASVYEFVCRENSKSWPNRSMNSTGTAFSFSSIPLVTSGKSASRFQQTPHLAKGERLQKRYGFKCATPAQRHPGRGCGAARLPTW